MFYFQWVKEIFVGQKMSSKLDASVSKLESNLSGY